MCLTLLVKKTLQYLGSFRVMKQLMSLLIVCCSFPSIAQQKIDSLINIYEDTPGNSLEEIQKLNETSKKYTSSFPSISEQFARKALTKSTELENREEQAGAHLNLSEVFRTRSDLTKALEHAFSALNIFEELGDSSKMAASANSIGRYYADIGEWEDATKYYNLSLELCGNDLKTKGKTLNNIGSMYHNRDNLDSAHVYFEKALDIGLEIKDQSGLATVYGNLGIIHLQKFNDPEKAKEYYERSIAMKKELIDFFGLSYSYINMGNLHRNIGKYDQARKYYSTAVAYTDSAEAKWVKSAAYSRWGRSEGLAGNEGLKNEYTEISRRLQREVLIERQESELKQLEASYNLEKRDRELLISKQNLQILENDRKIKVIQIAFLIVTLVLLGVLFFLQKSKNKKTRETQQAKNDLLTTELGYKTNELNSFTLNLIQKQDMMSEISALIKDVKRSSSPEKVKKSISELDQVVSRQARSDKEWEDFRSYFDKVHTDFFKTLKLKFPSLGISELRLAALIKLNLSIKETSSILGISPNSVKTARYRLRTKLNLAHEESLSGFLITFDG